MSLTASAEPAPTVAQRAPFRSAAEAGPFVCDARIDGKIPEWLRGDLVRTAPAVFERTDPASGRTFRARHWFDALGLLYGFRVGDGGVKFRQRLMATEVEVEARGGRTPTASFGSPIERSFWRRLIEPRPRVTDNVNVNVIALGDERVAMTESSHQWAFDPDTLALTRRVAYDDRLGAMTMIAHPHFDFARGVVVNLGVELGPASAVVVYEHAPTSRTRRVVGRVPLRRVPYVHAFGLTPRHAVIIGHPLTVSPLSLLWSNRGFIDHFQWRPETGTTLWLVDRASGQVRTHQAPPGFVFHVVNAFEAGADTVLDVALYPDAGIVDALRSEPLARGGLPPLTPAIVRYTMTPGREHAAVETVLARGFEFPSIAYRTRNGQRHAASWGTRIDAGLRSSVIRLDAGGAVRTHADADFVFGEPIFVARPGAREEDAGALLVVGSHRHEDRSQLRILDAATLEPLATAEAPLPLPLGFHGSFFRDAHQ
ncbi:carotenoid oxygenase family protein [Nannocystis punicea]|uniref:Carotenoid oxygenase family protein n=1 Tax=Nannocystis punicea TaxID=2995304 RepID=A0ABY7HDC7_9BACT|nr:carotenoid oxygenase family protein [Nannocystis poenicansa]WAS97298.1 carotenoid oxygenase family protein [Nannocystis poenicansa]